MSPQARDFCPFARTSPVLDLEVQAGGLAGGRRPGGARPRPDPGRAPGLPGPGQSRNGGAVGAGPAAPELPGWPWHLVQSQGDRGGPISTAIPRMRFCPPCWTHWRCWTGRWSAALRHAQQQDLHLHPQNHP